MIELSFDGTSHGEGYVAVLRGIPSGVKLNSDEIMEELKRRRFGLGRGPRSQMEKDEFRFEYGVKDNVTTGGDIRFFVPNNIASRNVGGAITALRSGHADLNGCVKLGLSDARPVAEEASARFTIVYVIAGAICKQLLAERNIRIWSYVESVGDVTAEKNDYTEKEISECRDFELSCPDYVAKEKMKCLIERTGQNGGSLGGVACVKCFGLPTGLGDFKYLSSRIEGKLAGFLTAIPSVKGMIVGDERVFSDTDNRFVDRLTVRDNEIVYDTNFCGGICGGMTNGQALSIRLYAKPIPTFKKPHQTVDIQTKETVVSHYERSDVCVVHNVGVVAESVLAFFLADEILEEEKIQFGKFDKRDYDSEKTVFVTDSNVAEIFELKGDNVFVFETGEKAKSFSETERLLTFLARKGKDCIIVAVGGGSVGDAAAFAASIFNRGVRLVQVPTTLLAMIDSSIGGKTAVNFEHVKNSVGTFYPAEKTVIDLDILDRMPDFLLEEGKGELFKYGLLDEKISKSISEKGLKNTVRLCAKYKHRIVRLDPTDLLLRHKLNLGHTLGHAFEMLYGLSHGNAVANGLYFELALAVSAKFCDASYAEEKRTELAEKFDILKEIDVSAVVEKCIKDKKNRDGKVSFVFANEKRETMEFFFNPQDLENMLKCL